MTTIEAALGGAVVLHCRDSTYRDIAGIHGNYRKVAETLPAIAKLAVVLDRLRARPILWLFDRPVSNSGRIRSLVLETAAEHAYDWTVELVNDPDASLKHSTDLVATSDSAILDCGPPWLNLARIVINPNPRGQGSSICRQAEIDGVALAVNRPLHFCRQQLLHRLRDLLAQRGRGRRRGYRLPCPPGRR